VRHPITEAVRQLVEEGNQPASAPEAFQYQRRPNNGTVRVATTLRVIHLDCSPTSSF